MRARPGDQNQNLPPRPGTAASQGQRVETPSGETAEVLSSAPIKQIYDDETGIRDGKVAGSAVEPEERPPGPEVDRWVVLREAVVHDRGNRVKLPYGKVVDANNYDYKQLVRQGVRLHKLEPGQDATEVLEQRMSQGNI